MLNGSYCEDVHVVYLFVFGCRVWGCPAEDVCSVHRLVHSRSSWLQPHDRGRTDCICSADVHAGSRSRLKNTYFFRDQLIDELYFKKKLIFHNLLCWWDLGLFIPKYILPAISSKWNFTTLLNNKYSRPYFLRPLNTSVRLQLLSVHVQVLSY